MNTMTLREVLENEIDLRCSQNNSLIFPNHDFDFPESIRAEAVALLKDAAARDSHYLSGGDASIPSDHLAPFGKWHRAANIVQHEMRSAGVPYLGDWSHRALMRVARDSFAQ